MVNTVSAPMGTTWPTLTKNLFWGQGERDHRLEVVEGHWPDRHRGSVFVVGPDKRAPGGHWFGAHGLLEKIRLVPDRDGRIEVRAPPRRHAAAPAPPLAAVPVRARPVHGAVAVRGDQPRQHQRAADRRPALPRLRRRPAGRGRPRDARLPHPGRRQRRVDAGARPACSSRSARWPPTRPPTTTSSASTSSTTPRSRRPASPPTPPSPAGTSTGRCERWRVDGHVARSTRSTTSRPPRTTSCSPTSRSSSSPRCSAAPPARCATRTHTELWIVAKADLRRDAARGSRCRRPRCACRCRPATSSSTTTRRAACSGWSSSTSRSPTS